MLWLYVLIVVFSFLAMEGAAWLIHKYVMHGVLWCWHKSHHSHSKGIFERNDLFSIIFSIPAVLCIIIGLEYRTTYYWLFWVGMGISVYGIAYFIFHDIIVHRRIKFNFKPAYPYLKNIIRAHKVHHKNLEKDWGEAFGFLYSTKKYTGE